MILQSNQCRQQDEPPAGRCIIKQFSDRFLSDVLMRIRQHRLLDKSFPFFVLIFKFFLFQYSEVIAAEYKCAPLRGWQEHPLTVWIFKKVMNSNSTSVRNSLFFCRILAYQPQEAIQTTIWLNTKSFVFQLIKSVLVLWARPLQSKHRPSKTYKNRPP